MIKATITISCQCACCLCCSLSHIQNGNPFRTERLDDELFVVALVLVSGVIDMEASLHLFLLLLALRHIDLIRLSIDGATLLMKSVVSVGGLHSYRLI